MVAALMILTACAAPAPAPPESPAGGGVVLPDRPRDVPLDGVDPCALLTAAQRAELGLDGTPRPYLGSPNELMGPTDACSVSGFGSRAISFAIRLSVSRGIEGFTDARVDPPVVPIEVAGFPAVLSPPPDYMADNCVVAVDVAPGQTLAVLLRDGGRLPPIPVAELCADVPRYAAEVMATLLAG